MEKEIKKLSTILLNTTDISAVRKKYQNEHFLLSSKLNHQLNSLTGNFIAASNQLCSIESLSVSLNADIGNVSSRCNACKALDENFTLIDKVFTTRKRLAEIKEFFERLQIFPENVARLLELFQADLDQDYMRADNLLVIYMYIVKLEDLQLEISYKATDTQVKLFLNDYFSTFNSIKKKFMTEYLFELSKFLFDLIVEEQFDVIVWIAKIIEEEEKRDVTSVKVMQALESAKEVNRIGIMPVKYKSLKEIRNLKRKFFNCLKETVHERFTTVLEGVEELDDKLGNLKFYVGDLVLINQIAANLFPANWNIFDFFLSEYHRTIYTLMENFSTDSKDSQLTPLNVLSLLRWTRDYYEELLDKFGIEQEQLDPPLLHKKESIFIGDFTRRSKVKIQEWVGNLESQVKATFLSREDPPDLDLDDKYISPAAIDLFQIIKQNIDSAAKSSRGQLLYEMFNNIVLITENFQQGMINMCKEDTKKYLANPESVSPGLDHYLIMLGNTCLKWIEFTDDLGHRLENHTDNKYKEKVNNCTKRLNDGFLSIMNNVNKCLADIIMYSASSAIDMLFSQKWNSEEPIVDNIIATFDDFFKDSFVHCEDFLFAKLQSDLTESLSFKYLDKMRSKSASFKLPRYANQLKYDFEQFLDFFSEYKNRARVEKTFDPLDKVIAVLVAPKQLLCAEIYTLWRTYSDIPLWFLDTILKKRNDLDSSVVKEAIDVTSKRIKAESVAMSGIAPSSIFSRLKK